MVNFADAITGITVAGRKAELPNASQVRRVLSDTLPTPKPEAQLTIPQLVRTEVEIIDKNTMSAEELCGRLKAEFDTCGEWAPWSPIARMKKK